MKNGFAAKLIGKRINSLARVYLINSSMEVDALSNQEVLMDTLVFECTPYERYELLVRQAAHEFEKITPLFPLFADWPLEQNERLVAIQINHSDISVPFTPVSATEYWSSHGEQCWLVATLFSSINNDLLAICTEGDEVELLTVDELNLRLDRINNYAALSILNVM